MDTNKYIDGATYLSLSSADCPSSAEAVVLVVVAPSTAFTPASLSGVVVYLTVAVALVTIFVAFGPELLVDALDAIDAFGLLVFGTF